MKKLALVIIFFLLLVSALALKTTYDSLIQANLNVTGVTRLMNYTEVFELNVTTNATLNKLILKTNKVTCYGDNCSACKYYNGSSLIEESPCTK